MQPLYFLCRFIGLSFCNTSFESSDIHIYVREGEILTVTQIILIVTHNFLYISSGKQFNTSGWLLNERHREACHDQRHDTRTHSPFQLGREADNTGNQEGIQQSDAMRSNNK